MMMLKHALLTLILLVVASCASSPKSDVANPSDENAVNAQSDSRAGTNMSDIASQPEDKRIYFFEHQFLPELAYRTNGEFLRDLLGGDTNPLMASASEIVSDEYAKGITVTVVNPESAVLLSFANPKNPPDCFFTYIQGFGDNTVFFTYEKIEPMDGEVMVGMVALWTNLGDHAILGPRDYTDAASFIRDVQEMQ